MPLVTHLQEGTQPLVFSSNETSSSPPDLENDDSGNQQQNDDQKPVDGKFFENDGKPDPGYACKSCGRYYKLKSSLRNHQKWECGKEPQFSCPYCVYKAKQKMHINRHLERMHKEKIHEIGIPLLVALKEEKLNTTV